MYCMMWKLISVLLGLVAFGVVCITSVLNGEELIMAAIKAIASFIVLWVFFSMIGAIFTKVVPTGDEEEETFAQWQAGSDVSVDQEPVSIFESVTDDGLPSIEADPELGKAA